MRLRPFSLAIVITSLWAAWFIVTTWSRHTNLMSSHFDLGIMDQVMWQTLHGQIFQMTSPIFGFLQSRLAIHGDLLLLLYTPFYALWQDPRTLLIIQTLAVASGALPLFWLAQRHLSEKWSASVAVLYLLQPVLQWSVLFDVHAVVLATPLILWSVWAATTKRQVMMWILFTLALLAKEEVGFVVALTAGVLWHRGLLSRRNAMVLGLVSIAWVLMMTGMIIPRYADNASHFAITYFSEYGQTIPEIFIGLFRHPIVLWHDLVNVEGFGYLIIVLGSVAWLPLRRPRWLLAALPIIVMNLLSNDPNMQSVYFQYTATITPFIMLATIDGLASLQAYPRRLVIIWSAVWISVMVWLWAPLPGMRHHQDASRVFISNPYTTQVQTLAATIPRSTKLVVTNDLGPHFSRRDRMWVFPFSVEKADAAVVLLNRERDVLPQADIVAAVETLKNDPGWEIVESWNNELFYLQRINNR